MKKIIYVLANFPHLSETFIAREIKSALKQGSDLEVFSLRPESHASSDAIDVEEVPRHYASFSPIKAVVQIVANLFQGRSLLFSGETVADSLQFLKQLKLANLIKFYIVLIAAETSICPKLDKLKSQDSIHLHTHFLFSASYIIYRLHKMLGCEYSVTLHTESLTWMLPSQVTKVLRNAYFLTTISHLEEYIKSFGISNLDKVHVIRNGIDSDEIPFQPKDHLSSPLQLLGIGNLLDKKGFDDLIRCCQILKREEIAFECHIVGEGPERENLEELIKECDVGDKLELLGRQPFEVVRGLLAEADILLMPSKQPERSTRDGLPTVLIEAMAAGIPVISTNFAGIPDLVEHEVTGLLAEPADFKGLAEQVNQMISNHTMRMAMIRNGKDFVEAEHNSKTNVKRLLQLINN